MQVSGWGNERSEIKRRRGSGKRRRRTNLDFDVEI